ncbi:MAG: helix-turn-helix domain-containing protein [Alistipes sp.]|nr:helix-turn-helix domain-containing protein [Alistipes sp.]
MIKYQRIRDLREDADLSQAKLGAILHISQRSYSHFETGTRSLPVDVLIKLADFYNVSVDYLLERTDDKRRL